MSRLVLSILFLISLQQVLFAQRWEFTGGLGGDPLIGMTIGPNGELYALSSALHRSTDKGETWIRLAHEVTLASSSSYSKLACGNDGLLMLVAPNGVWKSVDYGMSWSHVLAVRSRSSPDIAITSKGTVIVSLMDSLMISNDIGVTWRREQKVFSGNFQIFLDSCDNIFLGGQTSYVYRSTNQGASWSRLMNGYTQPYLLGMVPLSKSHILAVAYNDMFLSSDSGRTWTKTFSHGNTTGPLEITSLDKNNIFFIDRYGTSIKRSTDMGYSWEKYDSASYATNIAYANNELYMYSGPVLRKRSLTDAQWKTVFIPNATVSCLAAHPAGDMFAGTSPTFGDSYYYYGRLWAFTSSVWQESHSYSAIPLSFRMVTAAAVDSSGALIVSNNGSIVISSDRGTTWTLTEQQQLGGELTVNKEGMIFMAGGGVFRSTDRGVIWDQFNEGMTDINTVSVSTANNGIVFVGGRALLYRSSDYGVTWGEVNFPFITGSENVRALTNRGNRIVAGVDKTGAYFSDDVGITWTNRSEGLARDTINDMLLTPSGPIFAATTTGIYEYTDSAGRWTLVSSDGLAGNVLSLSLAADGRLYIGTAGGGVFRSIRKYGTGKTQDVLTAGYVSDPFTLFPNPATTQIAIDFEGHRPASFKATIWSALGERLMVVANEGSLDISSLPSGNYFLQIESSDGVTTKTFSVRR